MNCTLDYICVFLVSACLEVDVLRVGFLIAGWPQVRRIEVDAGVNGQLPVATSISLVF